jgi:hypothetical protein
MNTVMDQAKDASNSGFDIKIPIRVNIETRSVRVRYPTDDEFTDWRRKKPVYHKNTGRGKSVMLFPKPNSVDLDLFNRIRIEDEQYSLPLKQTAAIEDAAYVVRLLANENSVSVISSDERECRLGLKVIGCFDTEHALRWPSARERTEFKPRKNTVTMGQHGLQAVRIQYPAFAELYEKLCVSVEGYASSVPIAHKAEVVNVLLQVFDGEKV